MRWLSFFAMSLPLLAGCAKTQPTRLHGKAAGEWIQAAQSADAGKRKKAVEKLGNAGAVDPGIIPALTAALQDRDAEVRLAAASALLKIGPAALDAVPALTEAKKDKDARVREAASKALEKITATPRR